MKHVCLSILVVMLWCVMSNAQSSKTELKGRQSANPQPYCTPEGCDVGDTGAAAASTKANPNEVLAFQLFDVYGRQVDSADYAGVPVLIFFGSCWCGGCMEDTKPFRQLAGEYAGKGLVCLRTVAGDNELAALDFQNHFRLPMAHLMDPDRAFESKRYGGRLLCRRAGARGECGNEERYCRSPSLHAQGNFWLDPSATVPAVWPWVFLPSSTVYRGTGCTTGFMTGATRSRARLSRSLRSFRNSNWLLGRRAELGSGDQFADGSGGAVHRDGNAGLD